MAEKVTWMVLKVDLQCSSCYKKIKKTLCKFPQIRDQVYDEQKGLVKITVVCCSPEKIRDKLCCKGGKVIKSIDIVPPADKPKDQPKPPADKPKDQPKPPADKPKDQPKPPADKPKDQPKPPADKPKEEKPKVTFKQPENPPKEAEKPKDAEKPKPQPADKPKDTPKPAADPPKKADPVPVPVPAPVIPLPPAPVVLGPCGVPVGFCCPQCYEGHGWGPCYVGYGRPVPPPPCYDNYYGGYGYNPYVKGSYVSRCDDYFSEENTSGCRIM